MVTANEAESTLKTIRSLMERATIYRAISAHSALLAGVLSLIVAIWGAFFHFANGQGTELNFVLVWVIVCAFVSVVNAIVLHKQAWLRGDPFVSPGMRLALRGIVPPILAGLAVTLMTPPIPMLVSLWMLFYGLALLSTQEFAPASIQLLGRAFVAAGVLTGLLWSLCGFQSPGLVFSSVAMGLSFGVLHLVYGALTRPRGAAVEPETNASI